MWIKWRPGFFNSQKYRMEACRNIFSSRYDYVSWVRGWTRNKKSACTNRFLYAGGFVRCHRVIGTGRNAQKKLQFVFSVETEFLKKTSVFRLNPGGTRFEMHGMPNGPLTVVQSNAINRLSPKFLALPAPRIPISLDCLLFPMQRQYQGRGLLIGSPFLFTSRPFLPLTRHRPFLLLVQHLMILARFSSSISFFLWNFSIPFQKPIPAVSSIILIRLCNIFDVIYSSRRLIVVIL